MRLDHKIFEIVREESEGLSRIHESNSSVLKELGPLMDSFVHIGGDEVNLDCWKKTESIEKWMKDRNWDASRTMKYFMLRVHDIVTSLGKEMIAWEEVFASCGKSLDKSVILQVWLSAKHAIKFVEAGHRVIFDPYPTWYLVSCTEIGVLIV